VTKPHLISFDLCPFVQRSAITLQEKGVDYDITYIDLAAKPDWFLEISPMGKVPVLKVGDVAVFESAVINEYLDEVHGPQIHPADPLTKAVHRAWIEVTGQLGGPSYLVMVAPTEDAARGAVAKARKVFDTLEPRIAGPLFDGDDFSLVDAAAASFLQRLWWANEIAPQLAIFEGYPKVTAWTEALLARESVQQSTIPGIRARFDEYVKGKRTESHTDDPSWLGQQLG